MSQLAALGNPDAVAIDPATESVLQRMACCRPELLVPAKMRTYEDELGVALVFGIGSPMPPGTVVLVDLQDQRGRRLASKDALFADEGGLFLEASEVRERKCRAFLPLPVIDYASAGTYVVHIRCLWHDEDMDKLHEFGHARMDIELPAPGACARWNRVEFARPLIWLSMAVARADHDITAGEVKRLSRMLRHALDLDNKDLMTLRKVMLERPGKKLGDIIAMAMGRFGNLTPDELINILANLAWADGNVDDREVDVIRRVARHVRVDGDTWKALLREHKLRE